MLRRLWNAIRDQSWDVWALTPLLALMTPLGLLWLLWDGSLWEEDL